MNYNYKQALEHVNKAHLELSKIGYLKDDKADNAVTDAILVLENAQEALQKAIARSRHYSRHRF
jgi:hypothetical protein